MAVKITIEEVHPQLDGEYELDMHFNGYELHTIKRVSGLRPKEFGEAFEQRDYDLVMAWAIVALQRHGNLVSTTPWSCPEADALLSAPSGKITLDYVEDEVADEEQDARPPEEPASETESASEQIAKSGSSGGSSRTPSGSPESAPSPIGDLS